MFTHLFLLKIPIIKVQFFKIPISKSSYLKFQLSYLQTQFSVSHAPIPVFVPLLIIIIITIILFIIFINSAFEWFIRFPIFIH